MEQSTGTWEASYMRPFIDWMGTQYNAFMGKNFDPPTVAQMAAKNPENLAPYMDQFYREYIEPQVMSRVGDMHSPEDVKTYFAHGKISVPGVGAIQSQGSRWHGSAGASAATAGISAGSTVSSDLPQQWVTTQTETGQAIDTGRSTVTTQGSPLEQDVTHRTDPGSQSLSGLAVTNAAGQVLPDSVSRVLVNKIPGYNAQVPGVDMNLGTPGASVTEAGADRQNQGEPRNPMLDSYRKLILVPKGKSSSKQNEQE
jgi:conjugal transfer mating pair stabilization protein TraG